MYYGIYNPTLTSESLLFKIILYRFPLTLKKMFKNRKLMHIKIKNNFSCWWTVTLFLYCMYKPKILENSVYKYLN